MCWQDACGMPRLWPSGPAVLRQSASLRLSLPCPLARPPCVPARRPRPLCPPGSSLVVDAGTIYAEGSDDEARILGNERSNGPQLHTFHQPHPHHHPLLSPPHPPSPPHPVCVMYPPSHCSRPLTRYGRVAVLRHTQSLGVVRSGVGVHLVTVQHPW